MRMRECLFMGPVVAADFQSAFSNQADWKSAATTGPGSSSLFVLALVILSQAAHPLRQAQADPDRQDRAATPGEEQGKVPPRQPTRGHGLWRRRGGRNGHQLDVDRP